MDALRIVLVLHLVCAGLLLITGGVIAWNNVTSKNLALATGTVAAAIVLFVIQLAFELRETSERHFVTAELTIDHSGPVIRQWDYTGTTAWRLHNEVEAGKWLAGQNPKVFVDGPDKVSNDLVLFSLVSQLAATGYDWQMQRATFLGKSTGTMSTWQRASKETECTTVNEAQLRQLLEGAGNLYAGAGLRLIGGHLCLPPSTTLSLAGDSFSIATPFTQVLFTVRPSGAVTYVTPGTGDAELLPSGKNRHETRLIGIQIDITFMALRANHRHRPKYEAWTADVLRETRKWFVGEAEGGSFPVRSP